MCRGGEYDGVRVIERATIERALTEQSHLEIDLSLGFPTRFSYGLMLGSRRISLYGPGTQQAFGHLGFTQMLAWADPSERAPSPSWRAASRRSTPRSAASWACCGGSPRRLRRHHNRTRNAFPSCDDVVLPASSSVMTRK